MPWPCGWSARASSAATGCSPTRVSRRRSTKSASRRSPCCAAIELPPEQADEQRDRLLGGFRWILVDEYQDIGPQQYELIGALAGRSRSDEDTRLNLFAVGDDDQNIYAFSGASVEFIRRFETDYAARAVHLVDNYRATAHLIDVANRLIAPAAQRMKAAQPIRIDRARRQQPAGGEWAKIDPLARAACRSCRSAATPHAGVAVLGELQRLASLTADWDWARCAVIAREWQWLQPLRSFCELHGIPVQMAREEGLRSSGANATRSGCSTGCTTTCTRPDRRSPRSPPGWPGDRPVRWRDARRSGRRIQRRDRRRRPAAPALHRMAGRMGPRSAAPAERLAAADRAPRQGSRIRSCRGARRRLGTGSETVTTTLSEDPTPSAACTTWR
ncbi:MAG: UvrD-helicase domain-containing protein [Candidatus Accumulibacter necessarius]|jgi:hypothetical protein|uniref:UvrD-helicase domain-containing protein n=1 Tax=Candidatus Accumulibacter necessarius TaxID=2954386 RepID=UPI002FC3B365